jgi:type IV pilus assembly protein PilE
MTPGPMPICGRPRAGFTIIELLVAIAIVGILASIAVPSYGAYMMRSRILDAIAKLSDHHMRMEQYFLDRRTYVDDVGNCGVAAPATAGSADSFVVACAATTKSYRVTATGIAAKGMTGFAYTIDEAGTRVTLSLPTGWSRATDCWTVRPDGSCV